MKMKLAFTILKLGAIRASLTPSGKGSRLDHCHSVQYFPTHGRIYPTKPGPHSGKPNNQPSSALRFGTPNNAAYTSLEVGKEKLMRNTLSLCSPTLYLLMLLQGMLARTDAPPLVDTVLSAPYASDAMAHSPGNQGSFSVSAGCDIFSVWDSELTILGFWV